MNGVYSFCVYPFLFVVIRPYLQVIESYFHEFVSMIVSCSLLYFDNYKVWRGFENEVINTNDFPNCFFVPLDPVIVKTHQPLGRHSYLKKTPHSLKLSQNSCCRQTCYPHMASSREYENNSDSLAGYIYLCDLCKLSCMFYKCSWKGKKARFYTAMQIQILMI